MKSKLRKYHKIDLLIFLFTIRIERDAEYTLTYSNGKEVISKYYYSNFNYLSIWL